MVLEKYRKSLDPFLDPLALRFKGLGPDFFSYLSLAFGVMAGISFGFSGEWIPGGPDQGYPWLLLSGLLFIGLTSIADNLDGRIARMTKPTEVGDFLDHTFDRISDVAILTGIAFSPYCDTLFGLLAVVAVLLTSYMGTQAQALGCGRNYSGVMGRADRLVLLLFITPFQFLVEAGWGVRGWDLLSLGHRITPMEVLIGIMLVGGLLTGLMRGRDTYRTLKGRAIDEELNDQQRRGRWRSEAGMDRPRRHRPPGLQ